MEYKLNLLSHRRDDRRSIFQEMMYQRDRLLSNASNISKSGSFTSTGSGVGTIAPRSRPSIVVSGGDGANSSAVVDYQQEISSSCCSSSDESEQEHEHVNNSMKNASDQLMLDKDEV